MAVEEKVMLVVVVAVAEVLEVEMEEEEVSRTIDQLQHWFDLF